MQIDKEEQQDERDPLLVEMIKLLKQNKCSLVKALEGQEIVKESEN